MIPLERKQQKWIDGMRKCLLGVLLLKPTTSKRTSVLQHCSCSHQAAASFCSCSNEIIHSECSPHYLSYLIFHHWPFSSFSISIDIDTSSYSSLHTNKLHRRQREDPSPAWSRWENAAEAPLPAAERCGTMIWKINRWVYTYHWR